MIFLSKMSSGDDCGRTGNETHVSDFHQIFINFKYPYLSKFESQNFWCEMP